MIDTMEALFDKAIMSAARECQALPLLCALPEFVDAQSHVINNPLCGDQVTWWCAAQHRFHVQVRGCALCQASAFWAYQFMNQQNADDINMIMKDLGAMLQGDDITLLPPFAAFAPLVAIPARHRCVLLPLEGMIALQSTQSAKSPISDLGTKQQ